jgi:sarcosine oxidase delta subunit
MRIVVQSNEEFRCPFCGQRYWLEVDETGAPLICRNAGSQACEHLDLEVLPTGESEWEVYFIEPESES